MIHEAYDADAAARGYVAWRGRNWRRRLSKAFETRKILKLAQPRGRVLDLACGGGRYEAFVACDRARGMVRIAHDAGRRAVQGDAFALPFRDGAFDVALCIRFLHHFDEADRRRALKELRRVARAAVVTYFGDRGFKARRRKKKAKRTRRTVPVEQFADDCAAAGWTVAKDIASVPGWSEQRIARLER